MKISHYGFVRPSKFNFFLRGQKISLLKMCPKKCAKIVIKKHNNLFLNCETVPKIRKSACFACSVFKSFNFAQILKKLRRHVFVRIRNSGVCLPGKFFQMK